MSIQEIREACRVCGATFPKGHQKRKYCSNSCRNRTNYLTHQAAYKEVQAKRYQGQSTEERIFFGARNRAKRSGIEFTIKLSDINFTGVCPITLEPLFHAKGIHFRTSPSLDRIDNSKGYVPGNVRVISYRANSRKGDLSYEEIKRLWEYVNDSK